MRYTEKWVWQNQQYLLTSTYSQSNLCRNSNHVRFLPWVTEYREKVRSIDTDEKAARAIREYWEWVAKEWNEKHLTEGA